MQPLVSVITPTKNRLDLLREAMATVQGQSLDAWEHIVVDDGSDDDTAEEVTRHAKDDARIRYFRRGQDQAGANVCRNLGIRASRGEFIVFLDSDDLLEPECLARRVNIMMRNEDLDFATFQTSFFRDVPGDLKISSDPDLQADDLTRFLFFELPWIITGPIWRKASLQRLGPLDESLPSWQDVELHIRALTAGCRYVRFPEVDHHVRWQFEPTKVSIQQRRSAQHLEMAPPMLERFEHMVRSGPGMTWVRQRALCSLYFFVAELWVSAGSLREALQLWRGVRMRSLAPRVLYVSGALLLLLKAMGGTEDRICERLVHKWKGWMRLRTNPELV